MSGIIGGAGSKSGVIGTTELDYEEGTWDATYTGASATGTAGGRTGRYTKIGNVVVAYVSLYSASTVSGTWTGQLRVSGFPFTFLEYGICGITSGSWATDNAPQRGFGYSNQTYMGLLKHASADARNNNMTDVDSSALAQYDQVYLTVTYYV